MNSHVLLSVAKESVLNDFTTDEALEREREHDYDCVAETRDVDEIISVAVVFEYVS